MNLLTPQTSWGDFFWVAVLLLLGYLLLLFISVLVRKIRFVSLDQQQVAHALRWMRMVYEPLALVALGVTLVLIQPVVHGLIVLVIVLLAFKPLRNYLSGRFLQLTTDLHTGQLLTFGEEAGTVQSMDPFGIHLQTKRGSRMISYLQLQKKGFTLKGSDRISKFHDLHLVAATPGEADDQTINERLLTCPYLDWQQQPEVKPLDHQPGGYHLRVLIRDESHLGALMALIGEWGFRVAPARGGLN